MKGTQTLFSSASEEWETPQEFYDELNAEFGFTLDPCATDENHKCKNYFTRDQDGLKMDWGGEQRVFCNPPYGRKLKEWVAKCYSEGHKDNTLVVILIPARTDTRWYHDYIQHRAEVRFIRGRLKFGGATGNAPFPNMLVIYRAPGM